MNILFGCIRRKLLEQGQQGDELQTVLGQVNIFKEQLRDIEITDEKYEALRLVGENAICFVSWVRCRAYEWVQKEKRRAIRNERSGKGGIGVEIDLQDSLDEDYDDTVIRGDEHIPQRVTQLRSIPNNIRERGSVNDLVLKQRLIAAQTREAKLLEQQEELIASKAKVEKEKNEALIAAATSKHAVKQNLDKELKQMKNEIDNLRSSNRLLTNQNQDLKDQNIKIQSEILSIRKQGSQFNEMANNRALEEQKNSITLEMMEREKRSFQLELETEKEKNVILRREVDRMTDQMTKLGV
ncbi:MAG: hypothetical protein EZS28_020837 [Streblomastix strix]|uniref:Uncharacterized protein n=1 Tax=Streblomastix strix TaxID=222440 RepID=A0A5J4VMG7_9EUKA|nr:MAG: hypothetical protein EZS28_020837 [Streblomastix strix]